MIINKKIIKIADLFLIVQFLIFGALLIWLAGINVTPLRGVQYVMAFWLYIIYLKGYRLRKAISSFDSEVVNNLQSTNKEMSRDYISWKHHIKKANKISIPFSMILLIFAVVSLVFQIPINIFKEVFLLIFFIDIMIYGLSNVVAVQRFGETILELHKRIYSKVEGKDDVIFNNRKLIKNVIEGFLIGVIFVIVLYYFFKISAFHYFLYYLAFSILYSLSRALIMMYRYFSNTLNLIDSVRLVHTETKKTAEKESSNL